MLEPAMQSYVVTLGWSQLVCSPSFHIWFSDAVSTPNAECQWMHVFRRLPERSVCCRNLVDLYRLPQPSRILQSAV